MAKKSVRPDFGTAGRLTVRSSEQGAAVNLSAKEFIRLRLTVSGPGQAVFSFGCQHRPHWSAQDFHGHPQTVYDWTHFAHPGDADAPSDTYALTIAFVGGITSYTFLMEKVSATGVVIATLKDFDASSTVASDVFHSTITLFVT